MVQTKHTAGPALKRCPFCGARAEIVMVKGEYFPRCTGVGAVVKGMCLAARRPIPGEDGFRNIKDAVQLWNHRGPAVPGRRTLTVLADTKVSDLKPGDKVITAEIHRVEKAFDKRFPGQFSVLTVMPGCEYCRGRGLKCGHSRVMDIGWGQQAIQKIIK